jgi:N-acetylglucosaminyldiphosphoundecaprenol N-acetyl-beta-D-mannosaminyltransferase
MSSVRKIPIRKFATVDEAKQEVERLVDNKVSGYTVAINAEKTVLWYADEEIRNIINESVLPIADGFGAILVAKILQGAKVVKIDLPKICLEVANRKQARIFIFGASEKNNHKAAENVARMYGDINIVGRRNGYEIDMEKVTTEIAESKPDMVFVALGSPRQERIARELSRQIKGVLFVCCGGAVDVLSGAVKRAPNWIQKINMEWLYRLLKQPSRIGRHKRLLVFLYLVAKAKLLEKG